MDFTLTDDQQSLKELAARIFADASNDEALRDFAPSAGAYDKALWATLAETGLLGAAIEEEHGGLGLGLMELCLILEEQGRRLAPAPFIASLMLGALPLQAFGTDMQKRQWLGPVARGEALLTAAIEEIGCVDRDRPGLKAAPNENGWTLNGIKVAVPYGAEADQILLTASGAQGPLVFLLDPKATGIAIEQQISTGAEPQAQMRFENVALSREKLLGNAAQGAEIVRYIVQRGQIALAAKQVGVADEALRRTAAYTAERVQFGRPVGSMQAVQQRAADAFIDVEAMRSTMLRAAWALDRGEAEVAEVASAKYWAAIGGHRVVHTAQHLHGGLGADISYPIHRYFLEAIQIGETLGGAAPMLALIGREIAAGSTASLT